ncbi:sentrin-specific protease 2 [Nyctibius grandis]|uniref:sentrin-specific protease 2 n=1 Tax=Nyctibius grandis TaxID=48427 RepID=UPI0035BC5279
MGRGAVPGRSPGQERAGTSGEAALRDGRASAAGGRGLYPNGSRGPSAAPPPAAPRLPAAPRSGCPPLGRARPPPSGVPLVCFPSARAGSPVEDPDKTRPKKKKSRIAHYRAPFKRGKKVEEDSAGVKLPDKATRQKASVSNGAPTTKPAKKIQYVSCGFSLKRPTKRRADSALEEADNIPRGTRTWFNRETLSRSLKAIPCLSTSRNDKYHTKPGGTLTLKPLIKKLEASRLGRLCSAAEESVRREEKEKHERLLKLLKERYPECRPSPQLTTFSDARGCSKEPVVLLHRLEDQKNGGKVCVKCADVCKPQQPQRSDVLRSNTPAENSREQGGPVNQAVAVKQVPDVAPVQSRKSPARDVEGKKFPSLARPVEGFCLLSEAMEREVDAAFGQGLPSEVLSSAFNLEITRESICTLRECRWLNDEVINFYMNLVMERSKKEGYPTVHVFSPSFYPKLISAGYDAAKRWTRGVDLFSCDIILVPIRSREHWALVAIDIREKTVKYYDSLGRNGEWSCGILFRYLQEESLKKRNVALTVSEWTLRSMEPDDIPQQYNASDCGVFVCKYADYFSQDKPLTFNQLHMPSFRRRMVWEIIHQQLL